MSDSTDQSAPRRALTLRDVSEASGVSEMTVSRVLRNRGDVSEATRVKVREAARELGVSPRTIKRMLLDGRLRKRGRGVEVTSLRTYQQNQA